MSKIQCPKCKEKIDSKAEICPWCQTAFTPEEMAARPAGEFRKWMIGGGALLLLLCGAIWWSGGSKDDEEDAPSNRTAYALSAEADDNEEAANASDPDDMAERRAEADEADARHARRAARLAEREDAETGLMRTVVRAVACDTVGGPKTECGRSTRSSDDTDPPARRHAHEASTGTLVAKAADACFSVALGALQGLASSDASASQDAKERRCGRSIDKLMTAWNLGTTEK